MAVLKSRLVLAFLKKEVAQVGPMLVLAILVFGAQKISIKRIFLGSRFLKEEVAPPAILVF